MSTYSNCIPEDIATDIVFTAEGAGINVEFEYLTDCGSVYEGDPEDELTHISFYLPHKDLQQFQELLSSKFDVDVYLFKEDDMTDDYEYNRQVVEYGCNKTFYWYVKMPTEYSRCRDKHVEHIGLVFPLV